MKLYSFKSEEKYASYQTVKGISFEDAVTQLDEQVWTLESELDVPAEVITTVLGDSKPIEYYFANGSFNCPFCGYPAHTPSTTCQNPYCEAHPGWKPETLATWLEKRNQEREEEERRKRDMRSSIESSRNRERQHLEWQKEQVAIAREGGFCLNCLFSGYESVKHVKHRKGCPKRR